MKESGVIECYAATAVQDGRGSNEDAFLIGRVPVPHAAVCDGAGNAEQAARRALKSFKALLKDAGDRVHDLSAWRSWIKLMDSALLEGGQSTFLGVAVSDEPRGVVIGAYAGDSRAYVAGESGIRLVTTNPAPARLGSGRAEAGSILLTLGPGDILLLMSDGAWTPLGGPYGLRKAVGDARAHLSDVPEAVLAAAGRYGRADDMTVVALSRR